MVFDKFKEMVAQQLDIKADTVTLEADIIKDLGADSLDIVELLMEVEKEWKFTVEDDEVPGLKTIGDIVSYIERKKTI